jgi:hypothetical protein
VKLNKNIFRKNKDFIFIDTTINSED